MTLDAMGYTLVLLAIGISFVSFKTAFPLFKYGSSVIWLAVLMWFKDHSPSGTEGDPFQVVIILAAFVMIFAFPLMNLGRDIKKNKGNNGLSTTSSSVFNLKLPKIIRPETAIHKENQLRRAQYVEEYRRQVHSALNPNRRNGR